jgi:hypothetical protein
MIQWSTDLRRIRAALWSQAFKRDTCVSCSIGQVMGIRRRKGQLLALIRGWGRWYPVEYVLIISSHARSCHENMILPQVAQKTLI